MKLTVYLLYSWWFEPGSNIWVSYVIVQVSVVLRRTIVCSRDWFFDHPRGTHRIIDQSRPPEVNAEHDEGILW